jgi:hypothetical protein
MSDSVFSVVDEEHQDEFANLDLLNTDETTISSNHASEFINAAGFDMLNPFEDFDSHSQTSLQLQPNASNDLTVHSTDASYSAVSRNDDHHANHTIINTHIHEITQANESDRKNEANDHQDHNDNLTEFSEVDPNDGPSQDAFNNHANMNNVPHTMQLSDHVTTNLDKVEVEDLKHSPNSINTQDQNQHHQTNDDQDNCNIDVNTNTNQDDDEFQNQYSGEDDIHNEHAVNIYDYYKVDQDNQDNQDNQADRDNQINQDDDIDIPTVSASDSYVVSDLDYNDPRYLLCYSYALAAWGDRMWEFASILFVTDMFPTTLFPPSLFGFMEVLAGILAGPRIGSFIDNNDRLDAILVSVVGNNVIGIICTILFIIALINAQSWSYSSQWIILAIILPFAMLLKCTGSMHKICIHKDWLVVLADQNKPLLTVFNTIMRRIDLMCSVVAPLLVGAVAASSSTTAAAVVVAVW